MSSRKTKLIESAQKFILKGQYDRAVIEYRQLVELEPHDLRHRQKVAEILTKANQKEEALKEYASLAKHYVDSVHYLKAIAVYKQIQKLDPTNPETSLTLAALNEKQGLIGNATSEYAAAVQIYESRGENLKALKALESIMALDSGNSAVKLRAAEKYFTTGSEEKAFNTFASLLSDLKERNDENGFNLISERAFSLFGDKAKELVAQTSEDRSDEELHVEASASIMPPIPAAQADTLPIGPESTGTSPVLLQETDVTSESHGADIYEEIEYIEDILPIDDDNPDEQTGFSESGDEWEEIDLIDFDEEIQSERAQHEGPDIPDEMDTDSDLYELELELEIEDGDGLSAPDVPHLQTDETVDLGKDLSIFADAIDFGLLSVQNNDTTFDITSSGFTKGELDNEDAESHYSLGLAYKEMGLFDEAISEFIIASRSRERKVDSNILQGVCLREVGNIAKALEMLSDTLNNQNVTDDERLGIQYELALCHEATGGLTEARSMYTAILKARPAFNDVAIRLKNLPV